MTRINKNLSAGSFLRTIKFIVLSLLLAHCTTAQTYEEKYNLNFRLDEQRIPGWTSHPRKSAIRLEIDSTDVELPVRIYQTQFMQAREKLRFLLGSREILLPEDRRGVINIKVKYKCMNLEYAYLVVDFADSRERIIRVDTIRLPNTEELAEKSISFDLPGVRVLSLQIEARGLDSTYIDDVSRTDATIPEEFFIKGIQITVDGKDINNTVFQDVPPLSVKKDWCVDLNSASGPDYSHIPLLAKKKIIALGECAHGSGKIQQSSYDLIKHQIVSNRCRLVLMETSMLVMLYFNQYIQGDDLITSERLREVSQGFLHDTDMFLDFLEWLKEFNKTALEKVKVSGMDNHYGSFEVHHLLYNYLQTINETHHSSLLESVTSQWSFDFYWPARMIMSAQESISIIENNKAEFECLLGKADIQILCFYFRNLINFDYSMRYDHIRRDYNMFNNVSFLVDSVYKTNEQVMISCHFGHANHISMNHSSMCHSMGYHLKKEYKDDYCSIAQLVYEDSILIVNRGKKEKYELPGPSANSLRSALKKTGLNRFFIDTGQMNQFVRMEQYGTYILSAELTEQFINPRFRMDGIIFMR